MYHNCFPKEQLQYCRIQRDSKNNIMNFIEIVITIQIICIILLILYLIKIYFFNNKKECSVNHEWEARYSNICYKCKSKIYRNRF